MIYLPRKFIAVLLAFWLPLFSGNALAASIAMQTMGGDCHVAMQAHTAHHDASMHQHMHHAGHMVQQVQHDQQTSRHKDCGVCQLACGGYLAAVMIEIAKIQLSALSFTPAATLFQSVTSAPLLPPPLALA